MTATGDASMVYSIVGGADAALFEIDADTGELTFASLQDYDDPGDANADGDFEVDVQAANGVSPAATQSITATLTNVADVQTTVNSGQSFSVSESVSSGTTVGTVAVTAGDSSVTGFAIVSGNTGTAFAISSAGVITTAAALDYATLSSYTLGVTVTDSTGTSSAVDVGITVTEAVVWPTAQSFTAYATVDSTSQSMPALRTPVADATFAQTNLTRISDPSEIAPGSGSFNNFGPFYSARQLWNADQSRFILTAYNTGADGNYSPPYDRNHWLVNAATKVPIGPIRTAGGTDVSNHWRWSNTDPNELIFLEYQGTALKAFDVSDMTISTIKDFSATYDQITDDFNGGVGDPSKDGRYWALGGRKSGADWYVACWDRTLDSISCEIPVPVEPGTSYLPQVHMDPTGQFVLIWGTTSWMSGATSVGRGLSVWDKSGNLLRVFNDVGGGGATDIVGDHNSVGTDVDGNPVVIYFHTPDGSSRYFASRRLDIDQSGAPTQQSPAGMILGRMYVTPFAFDLDGWAVISDYPFPDSNSSFNAFPLRGHAWKIKLDGSQTVYPFCESRFSLADYSLAYNYLQFPWATPNRDLTEIMFKSAFDTDWSAGSGSVPTDFHAIIASASGA